jgi:5'-3' exonuclease
MGIHLLNTFLKSLKDNGSRIINIGDLRNKTIVVDASIYMYRFAAMNGLLENTYLMCSIFRSYNINILFVFDGKIGENKENTLLKRREEREKAKKEYYECSKLINNADENEKEILEEKMNKLRRTFVKITNKDIRNVKELLYSYGIEYVVANGEADELCARMVIDGMAYACLSEDTDLFAYGCPRILKYMSLMNHTVVLYPICDILKSIKIKFIDFQTLCILSGTDYNDSKRNIFSFYKLFKKYNCKKEGPDVEFIDWLKNEKYISLQIYYQLKDIHYIYNKDSKTIFQNISISNIRNKKIEKNRLRSVMKEECFVFAN